MQTANRRCGVSRKWAYGGSFPAEPLGLPGETLRTHAGMKGRLLSRIDCRRCRHYFVTWDPSCPHGCRRMGFKSRRHPAEEVRRTMSGRDCLLFQAKTAEKTSAPLPDDVRAPVNERPC